jgi:hypothetical protein
MMIKDSIFQFFIRLCNKLWSFFLKNKLMKEVFYARNLKQNKKCAILKEQILLC